MTEKEKEKKTETPEKEGAAPGKIPLVQEKVDLTLLMERTTERIAFLKKQQEDLHKQRAELEELTRQRKELDGGKREILINLERAVAVLENEENDLSRKHALVQATKDEFKKILKEVRSIREEIWEAENIKGELSQALALIAKARRDFKKAQGQIEALTARPLERSPEIAEPMGPATGTLPLRPEAIFKKGMLFFLPAALLALAIVIIARFLSSILK